VYKLYTSVANDFGANPRYNRVEHESNEQHSQCQYEQYHGNHREFLLQVPLLFRGNGTKSGRIKVVINLKAPE
jgi:dephospho-CoA kinase